MKFEAGRPERPRTRVRNPPRCYTPLAKLMDEWVSVYFYRMMLWWGNRKPSRRQFINDKILTPFLADFDRIERSYKVFNAWISKYDALPQLDATSSEVAILWVEIQHEGWRLESPSPAPSNQ